MGTRADFYIDNDGALEWLGSIAWDGFDIDEGGYPEIGTATDAGTFRKAVAEHLANRDDGSTPEHGWPWPWTDSRITGLAYVFSNGKVVTARPSREDDEPRFDWPDMTGQQNTTLGKRSGLMVFLPRS